jgi:hypothetical protein
MLFNLKELLDIGLIAINLERLANPDFSIENSNSNRYDTGQTGYKFR